MPATAGNKTPTGADKTVTTNEDTAYTFLTADFGFSDPRDAPPNNLAAVNIATTPAAGNRTVNHPPLNSFPTRRSSDLAAGKLKFSLAANAHGSPYTTFTFQVRDDGG